MAGFWPAQLPLSDCLLLADAGLLCIANVLVKEAAALFEKDLVNFGFMFFLILLVQLPSSLLRATQFPSCTH